MFVLQRRKKLNKKFKLHSIKKKENNLNNNNRTRINIKIIYVYVPILYHQGRCVFFFQKFNSIISEIIFQNTKIEICKV